MSETKIAYIDGIDWQEHVGVDTHGVRIFPSIKALRAGNNHDLSECGIVKIAICEIEWVEPQNLHIEKYLKEANE